MYLESEKLRQLVGLAEEITSGVVARDAEREDREAEWPAPSMAALKESGLTGLHVSETLGGHGEGMQGLVAITEVLAKESGSTALCYAMHCVGTAVIGAKATKNQEESYLAPIARGEHLTTLALSEPGTGSQFWISETRLDEDSDQYVVTGTKSFVTNGGHADSYVVSTVAPAGAAGEGEFSCVLVPEGAEGLVWQAPWRGLGMRANSSRTADLEGVRIPRGNLLGAEGDQLWYVFEVVAPYFLTAMAATYLGVAGAALETAREHLGTRRHTHTGELLGSNPVPSHRLGILWTEFERTRHLVHAAAAAGDRGDGAALTGILASKAAASEAAVRITNEAMTLTGGMAYRENSRLARMLRDARASHVMAPTTDTLYMWLGRALLNQPLL